MIVVQAFQGKYKLMLFSDLSVDFKAPLDNFKINKIENLYILENHAIIRPKSKSVKIKLIETKLITRG